MLIHYEEKLRRSAEMDTNILLESGTNELEILEFTVSGNYYGTM